MNLHLAYSPLGTHRRLRRDIVTLLRLFGIDALSPLSTLQDQAIARWVSPGRERWSEPGVVLRSRSASAAFWRAIGNLPLYHEIWPLVSSYRHVLLLGGTLKPQDRKNELAVRLWQQGIEFDNIVHLAGDRAVDPVRDAVSLYGAQQPGGLPVRQDWKGITLGLPETESDMMYELWQRSEIPTGMLGIPMQFIQAAATSGHRSHTRDTYHQWLSSNPRRGRVLLISISPHGPYQYWEAVRVLQPAGFQVHLAAAGAALGPQEPQYFLGGLARWLRSYHAASAS